MSNYRIELAPACYEVTVTRDIGLSTVRTIMEELAGHPGVLERHAVWHLGDDVASPPYTDFPMILDMVRGFYGGELPRKRVALVVAGGLNRAVADLFAEEASRLAFRVRVFATRDEALEWVAAP